MDERAAVLMVAGLPSEVAGQAAIHVADGYKIVGTTAFGRKNDEIAMTLVDRVRRPVNDVVFY